MKDILNSIIHDFITFYGSLSPLGLIIFYSTLSIIVILIIVLGIIERNRHFNEAKEDRLPVITDNVDNIIKEEAEELKEASEHPDIVEDIAKRNIVNIDHIAKRMEEDQENKNISLTSFEEDQEKNSIISYEELLSKTTKLNPDEIKQKMNEHKPTLETEDDKKFSNSPLLSPVYGIKNEHTKLNEDNNKKTDNIQSKLGNNSEFLKALKELKDKLD